MYKLYITTLATWYRVLTAEKNFSICRVCSIDFHFWHIGYLYKFYCNEYSVHLTKSLIRTKLSMEISVRSKTLKSSHVQIQNENDVYFVFDTKGIINFEFWEKETTVNQHAYKVLLQRRSGEKERTSRETGPGFSIMRSSCPRHLLSSWIFRRKCAENSKVCGKELLMATWKR